jgi:hypothetical protein
MEEVEGQVAVRMALSGPLNDKRVGSIGSKHSERTRRFSRLRLDVAVSATGWSEPVSGRELRPPKSSAFMAQVLKRFNDNWVALWLVASAPS